MPLSRFPTVIVLLTRFELGSMRETVPSPLLATHTAPEPTARAVGWCPTSIWVIEPDSASMRKTLLLPSFATHTAPAPVATAQGRLPTVIGGRAPPSVLGLISDTVLSPVFATHTNPPPAATPDGDVPAIPSPRGLLVLGSIFATVPIDETNQTAPSPTATAP